MLSLLLLACGTPDTPEPAAAPTPLDPATCASLKEPPRPVSLLSARARTELRLLSAAEEHEDRARRLAVFATLCAPLVDVVRGLAPHAPAPHAAAIERAAVGLAPHCDQASFDTAPRILQAVFSVDGAVAELHGACEARLRSAPAEPEPGLACRASRDVVLPLIEVLPQGTSEAHCTTLPGLVESHTRRIPPADLEGTLASLTALRHACAATDGTVPTGLGDTLRATYRTAYACE